MNLSLTHKGAHQLALGTLVALAFLVQSFVPSGYMPLLGSGKIFEIAICHGNDLTTILVDEYMQPVKDFGSRGGDHHKTKGVDKSCPFSTVSSKNLTVQSFLYQFTEQLVYERAVVRKALVNWDSLTELPYQGRAPPYSLA